MAKGLSGRANKKRIIFCGFPYKLQCIVTEKENCIKLKTSMKLFVFFFRFSEHSVESRVSDTFEVRRHRISKHLQVQAIRFGGYKRLKIFSKCLLKIIIFGYKFKCHKATKICPKRTFSMYGV